MIDLTDDELLVLFECFHRVCETGRIAASHHAEVVVIDKIAGQLERGLTEPFDPSYPQSLASARSRVLSAYRQRMGGHGWVEAVPLDQS
ncbi:MAG: hypothetical protein OEW83_23255 [Acidimicrobiia bacterium]|nr:hypothetical protein [Acidimicrobiia bacterium]